jgi:hypothetical protein
MTDVILALYSLFVDTESFFVLVKYIVILNLKC